MVDQLMTSRQAFSHLLFDLDHTLSYYPLSTADVVVAAFARLGLSLEPFEPVHGLATRYDALWVALERRAGSSDELRLAVWRRLVQERGLPADGLAERIATEHGAVRRANGARLFDGARRLLSDLRAAAYRLGLLTNGLSDSQWEKIRSLRLEPHFDAIVVAGDVNVYKPDPRAFAIVLERLGARASRTLFVGDSYEMDVLGAHAAGLATAWVRPEGTPLPGDVVPHFVFPRAVDVRKVVL